MNDFKFDDRSRGRDSSRRSSGGRDSRRLTLHDAVCAECGRNCQVPFRPSGDKPVYCSSCFEKRGGGDSDRPGRRDSRRSSFGDRGDRGPSRSPQSSTSDRSVSQLVGKIETLNTKLDTIISLLSSTGQKKSDSVKGGTEKKKKSKSTKTETTTKKLASVNTQKKVKSKPRKRAKTKANS